MRKTDPPPSAAIITKIITWPACPRCGLTMALGGYKLLRTERDSAGVRWHRVRCASCGKLAAIYAITKNP